MCEKNKVTRSTLTTKVLITRIRFHFIWKRNFLFLFSKKLASTRYRIRMIIFAYPHVYVFIWKRNLLISFSKKFASTRYRIRIVCTCPHVYVFIWKRNLLIPFSKKIRVHTVSYSYRFRLELVVWRQRFRKVLFVSVHTKTFKGVFKKFHSWRAFSKSCVFGHRFHRIRVVDNRIRNKKVAFSNENGYVWAGTTLLLQRRFTRFLTSSRDFREKFVS